MNRKLTALLELPRADYAAAGDILRVFCCFMVAWYHIWQQSWLSPVLKTDWITINMSMPVRAGYMFVDLMLLLSGFLLYLPYANHRESDWKTFYARRAVRILPSYWLCLIIMMIIAIGQYGIGDGRTWKDLLAHLSFTHNLFGFSYNQTRLNVVLWTLAVEVQFYLLVPVLAPLFRKNPLLCYGVMVGVSACFKWQWTMPMEDTTLFINRLPNMLDVYANGMLAAHIYAKLARANRRTLVAELGTVAAVIGIVGIFKILDVQARSSGYEALRAGQLKWRWLLTVFGSAFLVGGSLTFKPLRTLLSNRLVRFFSGVSFNFYIWHQYLAVKLKSWHIPGYVNEAPHRVAERPWQIQYTLLCFGLAFLVAVLITYLVEKPCARWGRRHLIHRRKCK